MRYFHDANKRTVWAVEEPEICVKRKTRTKRRKHPKLIGHTITRKTYETSADNWIDPETNRWHSPTTILAKDDYDDRDSRDAALKYFATNNPLPTGVEITEEEYERFRQQYENSARANKPAAK